MANNKIDRDAVLDKTYGKCAYCGEYLFGKFQVDHIIAQQIFVTSILNKRHIPPFLQHLTVDDVHHIDNLFAACRVCNKWKDTYHLELFRSEIADQVNRLNKRISNYRMAKRYGQVQETPKPIVFYFETLNQYNNEPSKNN